MRGKVSLDWLRETKPLGYTHTFLITLTVRLSCQHKLLIGLFRCWLIHTRSMNSRGWDFWRPLRNSEIQVCPWMSVWFTDWNPLCSFENPSWKHYSQLFFKTSYSQNCNKTFNSLMSVTWFWHVKSATQYILFINVPSVKWIHGHETRCFIDITCSAPLIPHRSTELRFWLSNRIANQSDTDFFVKGKKKKSLSYISFAVWIVTAADYLLCIYSDCLAAAATHQTIQLLYNYFYINH